MRRLPSGMTSPSETVTSAFSGGKRTARQFNRQIQGTVREEQLVLRVDVQFCAGLLLNLRNARNVIPMAVGQQNRLDVRFLHRFQEAGIHKARVNHR